MMFVDITTLDRKLLKVSLSQTTADSLVRDSGSSAMTLDIMQGGV